MKRKYILPGLLMILTGIYFFIASLPGIAMPAGLFLIAVGAALLIGRLFSRKRYGLTIAGFILFWLGMGRLMMDVLHIGGQYGLVAAPLSIALAFFMTHIFEYRRLGNWPIIPALILLGFATVFFLILTPDVNNILKPYYGTVLPLLLIILGIVLLVRGSKRSKPAPAVASSPEQWAQPPIEPAAPAAPAAQEVPVEPIPVYTPAAPAEEPTVVYEPTAPAVENAPAECTQDEEPVTVQPEPAAAAPAAEETVVCEAPAAEVIDAQDVPEEAKTEPAN